MRLGPHHLRRIRELVRTSIPEGIEYEVRLFGSRLDDNAKGGDVDLYLELSGLNATHRARLKRQLRGVLEEMLDLPVDLVIQERFAPLKLVSEIARRDGVIL